MIEQDHSAVFSAAEYTIMHTHSELKLKYVEPFIKILPL
jgi:hypothetical protein